MSSVVLSIEPVSSVVLSIEPVSSVVVSIEPVSSVDKGYSKDKWEFCISSRL